MKRRRLPAEKKALEYRRDSRFGGEYPQLHRRAWPLKKALRNRTYRRQVLRSIHRAFNVAEQLDDATPALPRRRLSIWTRRGGPVPLGEWVRWKLATRLHRTAWNFFKQDYDRERHRASFVRFLRNVIETRPSRRPDLVEFFARLLAGQAPMDQPGQFHRYYRIGSDPARWVSAFFQDEPAWESRIREWVQRSKN